MDKSSDRELLEYILHSLKLIRRWFEGIQSGDDFLNDDESLMRMDAIAMRLQSIGEAVKNVDKRNRALLLEIAEREYWSKIIKTREILTHHYIDVDSEIIFSICDEKLDELEENILKVRERLSE
jgi:uncharacterized protein with HEPN domain